ncbi:MAG: hypothetical protein NC093_09810 [Alistipes sp.]|nr:hypothetical protein [Alistipes sp.]
MMTMCAVILETRNRQLLVRDSKTDQEIIVNMRCSCNFRVGDRVLIFYRDIMTLSIPPQISALRITKAPFNICF